MTTKANPLMSDLKIRGKLFFLRGVVIRVLCLRNEIIDSPVDPVDTLHEIRDRAIPADLLTFLELPPGSLKIPSSFSYYTVLDNLAAVRVSTYDIWFKHQIHENTRKMIRKAHRCGVSVQIEAFTEKLAAGFVELFNETPIRRGRPYPYYGWDLDMVKRGWATELDRSLWLVAYHGQELIGFIKLIVGDGIARASGTITKFAHRDKATMNALLSKAVEVCASKGIPYLVYGKFTYGRDGEDSLTAFKKRNGFERLDVSRYYVPLSLRGHVGLRLGLHQSVRDLVVPTAALRMLRKVRSLWYETLMRRSS